MRRRFPLIPPQLASIRRSLQKSARSVPQQPLQPKSRTWKERRVHQSSPKKFGSLTWTRKMNCWRKGPRWTGRPNHRVLDPEEVACLGPGPRYNATGSTARWVSLFGSRRAVLLCVSGGRSRSLSASSTDSYSSGKWHFAFQVP